MGKTPTKADLSNPQLKSAFDPKLPQLLAAIEQAFQEIEDEGKGDEGFLGHMFPKSALKPLKGVLWDMEPVVPFLREQNELWKKLKRRAGLPTTGCEMCRTRVTDRAHIVESRFLKKAGALWRTYGEHPVNIMRLCPNHHRANDRNEFERKDRAKYRHLIHGRRKLTFAVRQETQKELRRMRRITEQFDRSFTKIEKFAHKELKALIMRLKRHT